MTEVSIYTSVKITQTSQMLGKVKELHKNSGSEEGELNLASRPSGLFCKPSLTFMLNPPESPEKAPLGLGRQTDPFGVCPSHR